MLQCVNLRVVYTPSFWSCLSMDTDIFLLFDDGIIKDHLPMSWLSCIKLFNSDFYGDGVCTHQIFIHLTKYGTIRSPVVNN